MKTTPENIAEWKALVPKLIDDSSDHMGVAHSTDMPPQHTVNFRHAKNAHEAAWAITNLISDLEDVQRELENERARGIHSCHDNCTRDGCVNRRLREELNITRKHLEEATAARGNGVLVPAPKLEEMQAEIREMRDKLSGLPENDPDHRVVVSCNGRICAFREDGRAFVSTSAELTMAPRKEKTVGYRDYYARVGGELYKCHAWENSSHFAPEAIKRDANFIRWTHGTWQYDEVEL